MRLPDLLDLINESTKMSSAGGGKYVGRCPFHDDSTPSFYYYSQTGSFYCFGCKKSGRVLQFLSYRDGVSIETLREKYFQVNDASSWLQVEQILHQELLENSEALSLTNELNFTIQMIKDYKLGFLNDRSRVRLLKEVPLKELRSLGMVIGGKVYLPNGVVLPLRTGKKMIGMQVRKLSGTPKYMTSLENESFKKREFLFNLSECDRSYQVIVVESPKDSMFINSIGGNSIATLGSNVSLEQVTKLTYLARRKFLYLFFDPDLAGILATLKLINLFPRYLWGKVFVSSSLELDPYEYCKLHGYQGMVRDSMSALEFIRLKGHLLEQDKVLYMEDIYRKKVMQMSRRENLWVVEVKKLLSFKEYLLPKFISEWLTYLDIEGIVNGHDILSPYDLDKLKGLILGAFLRKMISLPLEASVRWALEEREVGMIGIDK